MNIGGLTIEMAADLARLRQDMAQAKEAVGGAMAGIEKAAGMAKAALGALGVGLGLGAFAGFIKGAIDSADALDEMSSRVGVGAGELSKLKLAYQMAGLGTDAMQSSIAKLSKQIAEGSGAFDQLGVKTRNADGTLRSATEVMRDVADKFALLKDGSGKTALAMEIFGKSGADMVGVLNAGSKGLDEMAGWAKALGLVIEDDVAEQAAQFNDTLDLLHSASGGVATQLAAKMLPALNSAAGGFLLMMKEGQLVSKMADGLVVVFKLLYTAVVGVMEVFSTLGKLLGGTIAQLMAEISGLGTAVVKIFQGDFKGAAQAAQDGFKQSAAISREMSTDVRQGWQQTGAAIVNTWNETQDKTVKIFSAVGAKTKEVTTLTKEQEDAHKKAREELEKATKAGADWLRTQDAQIASLQQEIAQGKALTEGQKALLKMEEDLRAGKIRLTAAEQESAKAKLEEAGRLRELRQQQEAATKATEAAMAARVKEFDAIEAGVLKLDEEIAAQRAANETMLTGVDRTQQLAIAKLREAAASAERQAMVALERKEDEALYEKLKLQAEKFRELAELKEQGIHVKAAKDAADAWTKVTDQIGQGLTDSLFRAFESGKGFFKTLWDGIVNTFKTTSLKLMIQGADGKGGIMGTVMGALGMGAPGSASAGTGGGLGGLGGLSSIGSLFSSLNGGISSALSPIAGGLGSLMQSAGDWLTGGLGNLASGPFADLGGWLSTTGNSLGSSVGGSMLGDVLGYGSALLSASKGKWGSALGSGVGTFFGGPIGSAIGGLIGGAVDKLFGGNGTHHAGAGYVSDGKSGFDVRNGGYGLGWSYGDSVNKYFSADVQKALQTVTAGSASMLNELSKVFGGAGGYQVGAYFASDNDRASQGGRSVLLNGRVVSEWGGSGLDKDPTKGLTQLTDALAGQVRAAMLQIDLPSWARDALNALGTSATMDQLAQAVQAIAQTQSALKGLGEVFAPLGGVFARIGGLSVDATMQLASFAGGIDALVAKTRTFVDLYYSDQEKNALSAASIQKALAAAGIDATLASRDDFRRLVDSTDIQTEAGRRQLAVLLDLSQAFAPLGDYLRDQGTTLADLAAQAPQVEALNALTDQQSAAQSAQLAATTQLNDSVLNIGDRIHSGLVELGATLSARLLAVEEAVSDGARRTTDAFTFESAR